MTSMNHVHQENLFDPELCRSVKLIGAGSVGSAVALHLMKLGLEHLEVWDADVVVSHNEPMSLYGPADLGRPKVDALAEIIERLTGGTIVAHREHYDGEDLRNASVVMCVDTMAARKRIWEKVKMVPTIDLFLDTRTSGWYLEVLSVSPCDYEDIENYEKLLFDDSKAARQTCGRHGIFPVSSRAGEVVGTKLAMFWSRGRKEWRFAEKCDTFERVF